ncbi:MAG TPA: SBBP repeat-containing protein, partial [Bryobacteraceae bacterium]|nr:SBBP repeat-containing protein [Bryobacteraceae bacterium]
LIPAGLGNRPLVFEPNRGQAAGPVRFVARGNSRDYLLTASGVTALGASLNFSGANPEPHTSALDPLAERHNYFHGRVSQTDIPTYRRIRYSRLYPGIDCVFYGDQKGLEFDFEVSPGSDPAKIRLRWSGAKRVRIDDNGELVIETASDCLRQRKPTVYQERNGQRIPIAGGYRVAADGEIRFSLGRYDRALPLIIDPVLFALDQNLIFVAAMAADSAGNLYLTGFTSSSVLPTTVGAVQPAYAGGNCLALGIGPGGSSIFPCPDAFVIKLDSKGQIAYATYLGGSGFDSGNAIAVDSAGNAYVGGSTDAGLTIPNNFPTTPNAVFPKPAGNGGFVTKLNPAGSQLVYSTYFPIPVSGIAIDGQGNAYLVGSIYSPASSPFPVTPGALQNSTANAMSTGVVAKLNAAGSALEYGTYLGGSGAQDIGDLANSIAVDASGNAYVTGFTGSPDFPTTQGAFQAKLPAPIGIFVSKIAPSGGSLVYSTFLGSSGSEEISGGNGGLAIRVDSQGNAFVLGATLSSNFPVTPGAFQPSGPSAPWTAADIGSLNVLSKLNPTGSALVYSTYISGAQSLDIDSAGNAYVVGAASAGFPTTPGAYQSCSHGGSSDIFAAEFAPDGTLTGATYLGGSGADTASAVIALGSGSIDLAGTTNSTDFPGVVDFGDSSLTFVSSLLINDPNHTSGPCLAYLIQNAASFAEGAVAPGEVVTLRGKGIGPQTGVNANVGPGGKVPTELAGVQVFFGNEAAPLLYVQSEQINAVAPWDTGRGSPDPGIPVQVNYNGASVSGSVLLNQAAPGIFLANDTTQLAAITNADGTPNSPTNPAKMGSVVTFYGTGGGPMSPPGVDGAIWPVSPLAQLMLPVSVQINYVNADVTYAGSAPGSVSGIFQVNVRIPNLFSPPPTVPMVITIGGISSAPAIIAVQ